MEQLYPLFLSFIMVFIAELGDKTQLLVLSFSGSVRPRNIRLGIAIGSFFSHGIAIIFGSHVGVLENQALLNAIKFFTYLSFILIGVLSLLPKKEKLSSDSEGKASILEKISNLKLNYTLIIALTILVGEFGDKTFLASLGFGIEYPDYKIMLVIGSILGMVISDSLAIIFGKFLNKYISEEKMKKFSGVLFLIFGLVGLIF